MTGTLGLFSLVDLFQLLASSSRSGRLVVDHPAGQARVYFDKGRVVHAEFARLLGEEAVIALFQDERGSFEFSLGLPAPRATIETSTENLLLEAIRRVDEAKRDLPSKTTTTDDSVPIFAENAPDIGNLTLHAHEVLILRLVDGQRDMRTIAAETGLDVGQVIEVVSRLTKVGALTVRGKKPRLARLVTQLTRDPLPPGVAGVDRAILQSWERATGENPKRIACRRPNGKVDVFKVAPMAEVGPYILFSRDTLFRSNLAANIALLVKPA
ncbi:MAG TPA: DUF4388 domain-containing protein [Trueperaceae bacterium]